MRFLAVTLFLTLTAMAESTIQDRLQFWQHQLKLDDWKISLTVARRDDLKSHTLGGIRWDKHKRSATIQVLDPADYPTPAAAMEDIEVTIVHELVHLNLSSLPRTDASRKSEELAVNRLTDALLRLHRSR